MLCEVIMNMLDAIDTFLNDASGFLWGYILLFGLLGTHLYLTIILLLGAVACRFFLHYR